MYYDKDNNNNNSNGTRSEARGARRLRLSAARETENGRVDDAKNHIHATSSPSDSELLTPTPEESTQPSTSEFDETDTSEFDETGSARPAKRKTKVLSSSSLSLFIITVSYHYYH